MSHVAGFVAIALLVAACGLAGDAETQPSVSVTTVPPVTTTTEANIVEPIPTPDTELSVLVAKATKDLAAVLGVNVSEIQLETVEAVTWTDGSIGCPQTGMAYIQVLLDGVRLILEHDGVRYAYHQTDGQDPFLCKDPGAGGFITPPALSGE